jgi:hypothetical protein
VALLLVLSTMMLPRECALGDQWVTVALRGVGGEVARSWTCGSGMRLAAAVVLGVWLCSPCRCGVLLDLLCFCVAAAGDQPGAVAG